MVILLHWINFDMKQICPIRLVCIGHYVVMLHFSLNFSITYLFLLEIVTVLDTHIWRQDKNLNYIYAWPITKCKILKEFLQHLFVCHLILYSISWPGLSPHKAVTDAINDWQDNTCIVMLEVDHSFSSPHIVLVSQGGCWSYIGRIFYRTHQELSLGNGCLNVCILLLYMAALRFLSSSPTPVSPTVAGSLFK